MIHLFVDFGLQRMKFLYESWLYPFKVPGDARTELEIPRQKSTYGQTRSNMKLQQRGIT